MSAQKIPVTGGSIAAFVKRLIQDEKIKPRIQCRDGGRLVLRLAQGAETLGPEESAQLAKFFGVPELDGEAFYQGLLPENLTYDYGEIRFTHCQDNNGCWMLFVSSMVDGIGSVITICDKNNLEDGVLLVKAAQRNAENSLVVRMAHRIASPSSPPTPEEIQKGQECQQRIDRIVHSLYRDGGD